MTQNEVDIIKNAVLDSTEAYVDARLSKLDFVKTQIGVTVGEPAQRQGKYYHTVRCNATQSTPNGVTYNNVLSVGNIEFPNGSVVFVAAPNAQFSSQFILGKLDNTPCNIRGGSIDIGDGAFTVDKDGNVYCKNLTAAVGGKIGGFDIAYKNDAGFGYQYGLQRGDNSWYGEYRAGCGYAGRGIINLVGGTENTTYGYVQISISGNPTDCRGGIRIYYNGLIEYYDDNGSRQWYRYLSEIPT